MWGKIAGGRAPYIEGTASTDHTRSCSRELKGRIAVLFGPSSKGQLALVVYEWKDAKYLGVDQDDPTEKNEWEAGVREAPSLPRPGLSFLTLSNRAAAVRLHLRRCRQEPLRQLFPWRIHHHLPCGFGT